MTTALFTLIFASLSAGSEERVRQFTGERTTTTAEFEVEAPWILDWRVNSEFQGSMAIEISLVDGKTGFHEGLLVQTKRPGDGVKLFREGGSYRFRISSTLTYYDLRVIELTLQEAEAYTPRGD
ncbi:MAG: hypothetical protein U5K76_10585 [Woeseiaceae bacterium]|nr:hypothetical protein [Woeseiaceae bacterium]